MSSGSHKKKHTYVCIRICTKPVGLQAVQAVSPSWHPPWCWPPEHSLCQCQVLLDGCTFGCTFGCSVKRQKLAWFGHVTRHNSLSRTISQGEWLHGWQRKCWMDNSTEWTLLPMAELLTVASCRKDWKRISAESSFMSPWWRNCSWDWTEMYLQSLPEHTTSVNLPFFKVMAVSNDSNQKMYFLVCFCFIQSKSALYIY